MDLSAIALQGLNQADALLEQAAVTIASGGASGGSSVNTADLASEIVDLSSAKNQFAVNLSTLKVADEIQKTTVDLIA